MRTRSQDLFLCGPPLCVFLDPCRTPGPPCDVSASGVVGDEGAPSACWPLYLAATPRPIAGLFPTAVGAGVGRVGQPPVAKVIFAGAKMRTRIAAANAEADQLAGRGHAASHGPPSFCGPPYLAL